MDTQIPLVKIQSQYHDQSEIENKCNNDIDSNETTNTSGNDIDNDTYKSRSKNGLGLQHIKLDSKSSKTFHRSRDNKDGSPDRDKPPRDKQPTPDTHTLRIEGNTIQETNRERKLRESLSYFKSMYNYMNSTKSETAHDAIYLSCTPFHTALAKGDAEFIADFFAISRTVVTKDTQSFIDFVVNTPVTFHDKPTLLDMMASNEATVAPPGGKNRKSSMVFRNIDINTEVDWRYPSETLALCFEYALAMAASSGNVEVLDILLNNGANLFYQDSKRNGILHSLVLISDDKPNIAIAMLHTISSHFGALTNVERKHRLAFMVNNDGDTALDLAAKRCLPEMFLALIQWDHVYRFVLYEYGPLQHVVYDVTKYEQPFGENNLLKWFIYATEKDIKRLDQCRFFEQEPIKSWVSATGDLMRIYKFIWIFSWLFVFLSVLYSSYVFLNDNSSYHPPFLLSLFLITTASFELITQFHIIIRDQAIFGMTGFFYSYKHRGLPMACSPIMVIVRDICAVSIIALQLLHLFKLPYQTYQMTYTMLYICMNVTAMGTTYLFTQLRGSMSHLVLVQDHLTISAIFLF